MDIFAQARLELKTSALKDLKNRWLVLQKNLHMLSQLALSPSEKATVSEVMLGIAEFPSKKPHNES